MAANRLINKITQKEIQILYNYSRPGAEKRLATIRAALGLKKGQILTVFSFCRAEGYTPEEFDMLILRSQKKL